ASGDLLAAHLIAALTARRGQILFAGIGGPQMLAQGFESHYPMEKLSVRGYAEVLRHYREIMGIRRRLGKTLLAERPDLFIGVDSSDFNLGLEGRLKGDDVHFVCPTVTRETHDMFERAAHQHDLPLTLLFGNSHAALAAADLALVASGTATLETALSKTPMVIAYRQSPITWAMMRAMLYLPYVGMPNILAGERLVPELLQDQATPAALAAALLALLRDTEAQKRQIARFHDFHHLLRRNAAERAAEAVLKVLDHGHAQAGRLRGRRGRPRTAGRAGLRRGRDPQPGAAHQPPRRLEAPRPGPPRGAR